MNEVENKNTCLNCKQVIKKGLKFCPRPEYCQYEYTLKKRDPLAANILNNKDWDFYYLIGLIVTDGTLRYPNSNKTKNIGYSFSITACNSDIKLIQCLHKRFGGKISKRKDNCLAWYVSNKKFIEFLLNEVGITKNKTYALNVTKWFNTLSHDNKLNFLRGVIDGDGSIKIFNKNFRTFNICTGSPSFRDMICEFLKQNYSNNVKIEIPKNKKYSYIRYNGRYMLDFLNDVYKNIDNKIFLKRKFETFKQINNFFKQYGQG